METEVVIMPFCSASGLADDPFDDRRGYSNARLPQDRHAAAEPVEEMHDSCLLSGGLILEKWLAMLHCVVFLWARVRCLGPPFFVSKKHNILEILLCG